MKAMLSLSMLSLLAGCAEPFDGADEPVGQEPGVETPPAPSLPPPQCSTDADCDDGDTCWVNPVSLWSRCVPSCETDDDCDDGQLCRTMFDARSCMDPLDDEEVPPLPVDEEELPAAPLGIECFGPLDQELLDIPFSLAPGTTSAMVVPFTADGGPLVPVALTVPDGRTFDLQLPGNNLLAVTAGIVRTSSPLFLPQFPGAEELVQAGDYVLSVAAITDDLCSYVVTETADADAVLDVNFYYVGIDGLDAASAPSDPDLQDAISTVESLFAGAGVQLGTVRHFDVAPEVADAFAVITDVDAQASQLVATSEPPGPSDDDLLSVNVFLTAEFDDGGVIGVSRGLPGPIGLHGSTGSGVVLTAEFLQFRGGGVQTGQILAHELGHWLGLFHTTEIAGGLFDPLPDTPPCVDIVQLNAQGAITQCPDFLNLMFPFANPAATGITDDQADVLIANPVTR